MKIFIELLYNLGILISIGIIAGEIGKDRKYSKYYQGIVFGVASILVMSHPFVIAEGLIFDGRSIMISVVGAYFGGISAFIATLMAGVLRIYQGGIGMKMGVAVIAFSGLIGSLLHYYFKYKNRDFKLKDLYYMGLINHLAMTVFMFLLPRENRNFALKSIAPVVLGLYPLVTVIIGKIINNAEHERTLMKELKEKEETIKGISSNFQSGMIYQVKIGKKGREFTYISESVKNLYGCTPEEVKKDPNLIYGKIHKDFVGKVIKEEEESLKKLTIFRTEVKMQSPDGTYRWSLLVSHPRREEDGTIFYDGMEFIINDIKKLEEELIKEKNISEKANRAKSEFLANMSHELRTPMNGIIGISELLSMSSLGLEEKALVEDIKTSADNLLLIINDILDISKIESGKIELETKEFDLNTLITDILDLLSYSAHKKNVEVVYYMDKEVNYLLEGDCGKIRQVLINLIGNAIKFTDKGYVYIEIQKKFENEQNIGIEFVVKDTGIGIRKEAQKTIMEAFVQGDTTYTKQYQGSGLGLAISKNLVEMMQSELKFESEFGVGSKFYFELKLTKSKSLKIYNKDNFDFNDLSILLIDDLELNRKIIKKMLQEEGIKVYEAESGLKALDLLKEGLDVSIILTDINMPNMNGFDTVQKIIDRFGKAKNIIFFTSVDIRDRITHMNELGVSAYILKPIKRLELLSKLKDIYLINRENIKYKENQSTPQRTIFIVDDNYINLNLTEKILEKIGTYKIIKANNGVEAVELYKKENPDLIFLDIQMPIMNGFEAFEEIKTLAKENNIAMPKVVALSAYAGDKDKEKCLEIGMDDFVSKPFKLNDIKHIIDSYL